MKKLKIGQKVLLVWYDAFGRGGWHEIKDIDTDLKNPAEVETIGYFIREDKDFYILSMGIQKDELSKPFLHLEFIPKGCVKNIKFLK